MSDDVPPPAEEARKRPYHKPQVVLVQRRVGGDNLASGCKISGESSVAQTCLQANCFNVGS